MSEYGSRDGGNINKHCVHMLEVEHDSCVYRSGLFSEHSEFMYLNSNQPEDRLTVSSINFTRVSANFAVIGHEFPTLPLHGDRTWPAETTTSY